jgi:hypothetical protein
MQWAAFSFRKGSVLSFLPLHRGSGGEMRRGRRRFIGLVGIECAKANKEVEWGLEIIKILIKRF